MENYKYMLHIEFIKMSFTPYSVIVFIKTVSLFWVFILFDIDVYSQNAISGVGNNSNVNFKESYYTITGFVKDNVNSPVQYATICLRNAKDSTIVSQSISQADGSFKLKSRVGHYFMQIYSLPYESLTLTINLNENKDINVILNKKNVLLDEVVVTARKKIIRSKDGNLVIDITQLTKDNESLGKLMNKLPGVLNMNNKSVSLFGVPATVYIDGVKQNNRSLEQYLKSMPANTFSEVELISIPDGSNEGSANAIIKIKTKQKQTDGYYVKIGQYNQLFKSHYAQGPDLFLMMKRKNISYNTSLTYYNYYLYNKDADSTSYGLGKTLLNDTYLHGRGNEFRYTGNLNIRLKNNNYLRYNLYVYEGFENPKRNWQTDYRNNQSVQKDDDKFGTHSHDDLWSTNLQYENSDSAKVKIKSSYGLIFGGQRSNNHYLHIASDEEYLRSKLRMFGYQHIFNLDLTEKTGKCNSFFNGMNLSYGHISDNSDYFASEQVSSSLFTENEAILGLWAGWRCNISEPLSMRLSLRTEYTDYHLNVKSSSLKQTDTYWNFFPYYAFTYSIKNYVSTLGFQSGINRPNYTWMVPGIRYYNDFLYTQGNKDLKPTKLYNIIWNNKFFNYAYLNLRLGYQKDLMGAVYKNHDNGVIESTYMNYADQKNFSAYLCIPFRFIKGRLFGQMTSSATFDRYVNISSDYELNDSRKNHYWNFTETAYVQYTQDRLSTNVYASFFPKYSNLQIDQNYKWGINWVMSYDFLKKKQLTVSFQANDIFNTMKERASYYINDVLKRSLSIKDTQYIALSFVYRFDSGAQVLNKYKPDEGNNTRRFSK